MKMMKTCSYLRHAFFPFWYQREGAFFLSRNKFSIQCIDFRACPLGVFLKPCSICPSIIPFVIDIGPYTFLFTLASFLSIGANFRLVHLSHKAFKSCLLATLLLLLPSGWFFAVSVTSLSCFSSVRVGPCPLPRWDYCCYGSHGQS